MGVAFAAILRKTQLGLLVTIGLGYLASFVLLPLTITALYQVYVMARHQSAVE